MEQIYEKQLLLKGNVINKNGRIYRTSTLYLIKDIIDRRIKKIGVLLGELGYPENFDISLKNVSHSISNLQIIGDDLYGDIKILPTPNGKILEKMINDIVFRPRSAGITLENGEVVIKNTFTFDAIHKENDAFADLI